MSTIFDADNVLTVRVYKRWNTNPDRVWSNSYEFYTAAAPTLAQIDDLAQAVAASEAAFHYNKVEFDRAVVSTWFQDSGASTSPESFKTVNLEGLLGAKTPAVGGLLDLRNVLQVNFNAQTGRSGRRLYRGCVAEADVDAANSGLWGQLSTPFVTTVVNSFSAALAGSGLYTGWQMCMKGLILGGTAVVTRPIESVTVKGVTTRQLRRGTSNSG